MATLVTAAPNAYTQQKLAIQNELDRRVAEHRARFEQRQMMQSATHQLGAKPLNLIAQGDSWFDYPLPVFAHSDVIAHLKAMPLSPSILSLAHYGEAAEDMLGVTKLHRLLAQLNAGDDGSQYDAILFSGGGNDLAGDQFRLWIADSAVVHKDPALGLQSARVDAVLGIVKAAYQDLILARDKIAQAHNRSIPIFVHSYDFALPSGVGVCTVGPWLKPSLDDRGWDRETGPGIVKQLLTRFAELLDELQGQHADFIHVKTQGTLSAGQWANELHPTPDGFAAISAKFVAALRARFPHRI
ncbi:SGNH/GDSL hydrolase family protein [Rugamonas sp. CCM 8940]|uniref:SGNH/GDSL hydrolase family protein n=1 Tax=Rugamonas sp. CCM 8940 TaxID=2765359 RepID=UPI0018F6BE28|nr:SGNH/GDSL hydrolase family protein [Rugamonas sp. CCM 8940]MBJ7309010.1 SGNH/GDSL hydrolase family protein [Rugamonas sp. CCM 8940]